MDAMTGNVEKICVKCPWSDKRSLPYVLYCARFDSCKKRLEEQKDKHVIEKESCVWIWEKLQEL